MGLKIIWRHGAASDLSHSLLFSHVPKRSAKQDPIPSVCFLLMGKDPSLVHLAPLIKLHLAEATFRQ